MFNWYKKISLANRILFAMIIGLILGYIFKGSYEAWSQVTTPLGDIFIRLLRVTIVPLIFCSIISGISSIADLQKLKRVGGRFVVFWACASALAAICGIVWAYIIKPGIGVTLAAPEEAWSTEGVSIIESLVGWIPNNLVGAMANFNIIQVIVFAILAGITIAVMKPGKSREFLENLFSSGNDLMIGIVNIVMGFAPIGVLCLMADITGSVGLDVLGALGKMLATQYVAYLTLLVLIFPLILKFIAKVNPLQHYRNIFPAMILAFSTCSSSATLPLTMKCSTERCGVPKETVGLIAPPAATINMQACCAEMPIYAIFAAQLYGLDFSFGQLMIIILLGVIMAAGVAGVPGGGIMMSAIMMQSMGLPLTIVPWVAGIYRLIDMPNTMLNITGDTVGMVTVSSTLGDLDRDAFNSKVGAIDKLAV